MTGAAALLLHIWVAASVLMVLLWALQRRTGDAGVVDAGWAGGIGLGALYCAWGLDGDGGRRLLMACMGGAWAFRLAGHLVFDRVRAAEEDGRYQMLRRAWGDRAGWYFFLFFQFQALLVLVFALPFWAVGHKSGPLVWSDWAGLGLWCLALAGEGLADLQLRRFKADPANRGRTCRSGLWRYSRHPNYFFEWLHWWSYALLAWGGALIWLPVGAAVFMLLLIVYVTGIPYTEKRALASRGDDYRRYQQTTSAFFPWFSRAQPAADPT